MKKVKVMIKPATMMAIGDSDDGDNDDDDENDDDYGDDDDENDDGDTQQPPEVGTV